MAEILMLRAILGFRKRCLYVLPFVSIVTEKESFLTKILENLNVKIQAFHSQSEACWSPSTDLAICTIEKANSLLNKSIEEESFGEVEFVIIDEFHLTCQESRGYLLENLISKLRFIEKVHGKRC